MKIGASEIDPSLDRRAAKIARESSLRSRVFGILDASPSAGRAGRVFAYFAMTLIVLNVVTVVLGSENFFSSRFDAWIEAFDWFSVVVFTVEYALRLWSCTDAPSFLERTRERLRFGLSPLALIDALAIFPFFVSLLVDPFRAQDPRLDLRILRMIRLMRLARILKLGRYSASLRLIARVLWSRREELLVSAAVGLLLLVVSSSLMYVLENEAQPAVFHSIPAAMWWGVTTFTTITYSDINPVTPGGKLLGAAAGLLGIGVFALPAGILGSGFVEEMQRRRERGRPVCPHCGESLDRDGAERPPDRDGSRDR